ncbi:MAG: hypothetical protein M3Q33_10560 [Acidobacteriota bacterium]|nr:hypothetical protein [Acidobacteriota bacterium]
MMDENEDKKENRIAENLSAVGQIIIGEIETIGGILTADPTTQAEGEFNVEVGNLHQKSNKALTATEENEQAGASEKSNQT